MKFILSILFLALTVSAEETYDPFESFNRKIFWFNEKADDYVLGPIARTYIEYVPQEARTSFKHFFTNLKTPIYIGSCLLQLKFSQAGTHLGRFLVNSTVGVLGLFDVATEIGWKHQDEDIGVAFGYWGIPEGPYIVLPLLGPSNLRDFVGYAGDWALDPLNVTTVYPDLPNSPTSDITIGLSATRVISTRANLEEAIKSGKESSVDYYLFLREAYTQYRKGLIYDGMPPEEEDFE
jgi:phospholipid-binding lipoprotein MlaA